MMLIIMKMLYLYPLEVYNFEHRFSQNVIKNVCISLSFLAAFRITLSQYTSLRSQILCSLFINKIKFRANFNFL